MKAGTIATVLKVMRSHIEELHIFTIGRYELIAVAIAEETLDLHSIIDVVKYSITNQPEKINLNEVIGDIRTAYKYFESLDYNKEFSVDLAKEKKKISIANNEVSDADKEWIQFAHSLMKEDEDGHDTK